MVARPVGRAGLRGVRPAHRRPSRCRGSSERADGLQRAAHPVLRALRRATGRSGVPLAQRSVRPAIRRWPARQALRRPRRGGRQGPDGDVPGGATGLASRRRGHSRPHHGADRGGGGSRFGQPRPVPAGEQGGACRGCGADQRHRHVGRRDPCHYHPPARHDLCRGDPEGREPRPALRPVRRIGAQSDQRADQDPRRPAGRERPHPVAGFL